MSKITKKQQVINWFLKHPLATPKVVSEKFGMAIPNVYALRKQAMHLYQEQQAVEMNQETATHTEQRVVIRDFTPSEKADDRQVGGDHYKNMGVEPWNVVDTWPREQRIGYYRGDALKYLMRMGSKDQSAEEIGKGLHYMQKLLEVLNEVDNSTTEGYAAADMASAAAQGFRDGYASAKRGE